MSEESYVTTTDTCSNCGAKLKNAETSRNDYQQAAFDLKAELDRVKKELDQVYQVSHETYAELDREYQKLQAKLRERDALLLQVCNHLGKFRTDDTREIYESLAEWRTNSLKI